jgi:GMP synthase (glutamine-hydrolysing)
MIQPILIIKMGNSFPSIIADHGDFDDWIRAGLDVDRSALAVVNVYAGETLPDPSRLAGVVITGAHDMVTDRANWSERTAAWIPELITTGTPLLGICYGHQLLAHALGGTVGPNPRGGEFGTVELKLQGPATKDRLFSDLPQRFQVQASHFQSVLSLPPGAVLLAASNHDPHHAFCIANSAWGVQFHPEFSTEILSAYISKYKVTLAAHELDPEALLHSTTETPFGKEILRRFGQLLKKRR